MKIIESPNGTPLGNPHKSELKPGSFENGGL